MLGIKHTIILELKKIKEIKKKNTLGLLPNALKITTDDDQSYKFSSFSNRNIAYKYFVALWKNVSQYAKDVKEEEAAPEDNDSEEESEIKEDAKGTIAIYSH